MVARVFEGKGWSSDDYDRLMDRLDLGGRPADGVVFHWAAATEDGIHVVDVYESAAAADLLATGRIAPLVGDLGLAPPEVTEYAVHNHLV